MASPFEEAVGEPTEEELAFFEYGTEDSPAKVEPQKKAESDEPTPEELEFFEMESPYQQKPLGNDVGYWRSMLNAVPRGLIEGVVRFGRMMGPLPDTEEYKYDPDAMAAQLDEWFPTDDEFFSNAIKKTGQVLPSALGTPIPGAGAAPSVGSNVLRAGAGAVLSEGAKEAGAPEWLQTVAEIAPWLAPNLSAVNKSDGSVGGIIKALEEKSPNWLKKLVSEKGPDSLKKPIQQMVESGVAEKEILDFGRAAGMSEREITPLLQSSGKQKVLSKLASKGEAMEGKLVDTKTAIGKVYDSIADLPGANTTFSQSQSTRLIKSLQDKFAKMPSSVRKVVADDFAQLIDGPIDGNKLMKFFKDVNHELGPKTKQLSTLKDPIRKMLMEVDPAMGQMFDMTNKLYGKFGEIAKRLKPGLSEGLWSDAKSQGALWGVMTGDVGILQKIAKVSGAKKVAEFMLTSPRWQGLTSKMTSALNSGKFAVADHIRRQMIDEVKDVDPRVAAALEEIRLEETFGSNQPE